MLKNFILTSLRSMLRHKGFSFINIAGLAIGLAACIIILLFIVDELSYDKFHKKADRIYRITVHGVFGSNEFNSTYTPAPLAKAMIDDFPEIENITRLMLRPQRSVRVNNDKTFIEDRFFYADSSFFEIFSFTLIAGDPTKVLSEPGNIVLTESTARRYFGDEDPIGKTIVEDNRFNYIVRGIVRDVPGNSHFKFNVLASFTTLPWYANPSWFNQSAQTYIQLKENASLTTISEKLNPFLYNQIGEQLRQFMGITLEEFAESGQSYGYDLQSIRDIHLRSKLDGEYEANGSITYVYLFALIALFILLIACINFMNLSTARSANRAKEVGVRKVLGSNRSHLIRQFLMEAFLYCTLAMIIAMLLIEISLPFFNQIAQKQLSLNIQHECYIILIIPGFIVITSLLAGSYPAFYLSAFHPLQVIKGQLVKGMTKSRFRSLLVLFQYSVSIVLLIATFIIFKQLQFIQNKNMGYEKENVIVVKRVNGLGQGMPVFKNNILQNPDIKNASYSIDLPGDDFSSNSMGVTGRPLDEVNIVMIMYADYDFIETLGMHMEEGYWFRRGYSSDSAAVVINKTAMRRLGINDFEKDRLIRHATPPDEHSVDRIIGVVEDFHFESLHRAIRPMALYLLPEGNWANRLSVRVQQNRVQETILYLEEQWIAMESGQPFEYSLLDSSLEKFYKNDEQTRIIYTIFSILALLVASLGLLGLAAFTTENRTKEIGIRKAHGASVGSIVMMLSKEFTRWVLLANIIAWPVAYLLMDNWLNNFAFRIAIPWWSFIMAGLLALLIAIITVSSIAFKAANANPVEALKYE
ncbi:MAG: ABC transporter permease [Bacteroidales bacterium]|nr:ABC transporter permease [Bacteroidales bacterium]